MKLDELISKTDALTYLNGLRVTQTEIKDEISEIEQMTSYIVAAVDRVRKLSRKADNQYRVIAKLAQQSQGSFANNISIEDDTPEIDDELKEVMEEG